MRRDLKWKRMDGGPSAIRFGGMYLENRHDCFAHCIRKERKPFFLMEKVLGTWDEFHVFFELKELNEFEITTIDFIFFLSTIVSGYVSSNQVDRVHCLLHALCEEESFYVGTYGKKKSSRE
mmetsp:Transcript_21632/g.45751  ORF Transcript_21632/g.45751 Transcript_21632/m.45751 type:complete len:121 (+) Transcript_21632:1834-2196(+)